MLALRVPLNERRLAIVDAAFSSMSADFRHSAAGASDKNAGGGDDAVPLDFALDHWNPQGHPEVSAGRLTVDQARTHVAGVFTLKTVPNLRSTFQLPSVLGI